MVALVGDIAHSRTARSNIWGLKKMGADVAVCGPRSLLPSAIGEFGVHVFDRIEEAIRVNRELLSASPGDPSALCSKGRILIFSGAYVLINLLVDLSYALLAPRIRY